MIFLFPFLVNFSMGVFTYAKHFISIIMGVFTYAKHFISII